MLNFLLASGLVLFCLSVGLGVGTFRRGIIGPKPDVRSIVLGSGGEESIHPATLVELDKKLR